VDKTKAAMTRTLGALKVGVFRIQREDEIMADGAAEFDAAQVGAQGKLKSIVERIERLEEDKAAVATDLKEVYAEAKGEGFDTKILRKVVRLRKQDQAKRQEEEALLDLYISAIGGL
jgi:uncharacterized protein (UPF0335 family)